MREVRKIGILGVKIKHLVVAITIIVVICLLIFVVHQRNKASYLNLELTEYETVLYKQFAETLDDEILKNLSHLQLIKFLLHSEKEYDSKTEYYLFNTEETWDKSFNTYITEDAWLNIRNNKSQLFNKAFAYTTSYEILDEFTDEKYLPLKFNKKNDRSFVFWLSKNSHGIWKIKFEPLDSIARLR